MVRMLLLGVLIACRSSGPAPAAGSASAGGSTCTATLDELARLYDAVADDNAKATELAELRQAAMAAGVETLPEVTGAPADLAKADVLLVGTTAIVLVSASGEVQRRDLGDDIDDLGAPDASRPLVLEIDARVPWRRVEQVRQALRRTDAPYATVGVAYRVKGALAGRTPPKVPGADSEGVDIPAIGDAIAKKAAVHCKDYAKQLAALQSGGMLGDPALLHALARTISHCDCGVDASLLEALPWLLAQPLVSVVPFASTAPALHGADSATWADLVHEAKGPVPMAMPPPLPPPPPPPLPHRR
jgi:biopolymer transport protein ExbD